MQINTKNIVSITDANQNFSKVARMVDDNGSVLILKNNVPKYLLIEFDSLEKEEIASNEDVDTISKCFLLKNKEAYEVLAK